MIEMANVDVIACAGARGTGAVITGWESEWRYERSTSLIGSFFTLIQSASDHMATLIWVRASLASGSPP